MAKKASTEHKDVYQMVTDRIIAQMEQGIVPWRKPWSTKGTANPEEMAISHESGKPYSLLNQFLVGRPGEYLTFGQIQKAGGRIKKGEKSRFIVFWRRLVVGGDDAADGTVESPEETDGVKVIPYLKYYNVWHIDQTEGIEPRWANYAERLETQSPNPEAAAEAVVEGYLAQPSHPNLVKKLSDKAYYQPRTDTVVVPKMCQYRSPAEYYSTLFHELGHSTGHKDRLNRKGITEGGFFGSHEYSKEELVAEITAAMLLSQCGIEVEGTFNNSVSYLQSWIRALQNDKKMIVWAAGKAEAAAKWILGIRQEEASREEAAEAA